MIKTGAYDNYFGSKDTVVNVHINILYVDLYSHR